MHKVSVIIPCYNAEKYIAECLDSIINQTYKNIEIVIVDSSMDKTSFIINEYIEKYPGKIKYFYQNGKGPSAARRYGIEKATGDFIAFLDSDDIYVKDSVEIKLNKFFNDNQLSLVFSDAFIIYEKELLNYNYKKIVGKYFEGHVFKDLIINNFICTSTVMLKKEILNTTGNFNEKLKNVEDYELWLRISRKYKIGLVDIPLTYYRIRKGSLSDENLNNIEALICVFNKMKNNSGEFNNEINLLIKNNLERYHGEYFIVKTKKSIKSKDYNKARILYHKIYKYNRTNPKYYFIIIMLYLFPHLIGYFLNFKKNHRGFRY